MEFSTYNVMLMYLNISGKMVKVCIFSYLLNRAVTFVPSTS